MEEEGEVDWLGKEAEQDERKEEERDSAEDEPQAEA